jgi:hypothetical protein
VREAKQGVESLFAVLRLQDAVACLAQDAVRDPTSVVLIVDDKHRDGRTGQRGVHRTPGDQENDPGGYFSRCTITSGAVRFLTLARRPDEP